MAENLKLDLGETMMTQKISVLDQTTGAENSGSFVVDMETFCNGSGKDLTPNSRITLQRNLSRKWSPRAGAGEKKMGSDSIVSSISSPRGAGAAVSDSSGTGATEPSGQVHQITINTSSAVADGRALLKRNSFRRSSTWGLDPRRIAILSASLSSVGTMLLIYFTLSMCNKGGENNLELDWQLLTQ